MHRQLQLRVAATLPQLAICHACAPQHTAQRSWHKCRPSLALEGGALRVPLVVALPTRGS